MAQLTPNEILKISEPIEAVYQRTVDELLINIARHFNINGWERTRYWEIKKLSEMGALTKESAAIIAKNTQMVPEEVEKAFFQVSEKACKDIDPQLREAAEQGLLQNPQNTPSTSVLMRDMVQGYVDQAVDKLNMTNTTMLASTQQAYLKGITTAVNEAQLLEAKEVLEAGALSVTTGVETRTRAIRKAVNQLANTGITGFYDRAGRRWSAEAYAAMVVRTTAHNAGVQSIRTRQNEFGGGDIFQVSTHAGARPLCYPYQGKFFSWTGAGTFTDGAGHTHKYDYIGDSSYGEPAGLFGINCGHHPIPMIPNYSYPQDGPEQSEAENDKEYEESQIQRQYERQIREAKRDLEVAKATGDTDAIEAAKNKVAQEQAKMRAYTKQTGRARRIDREQIAGTPLPEGYKGYKAERHSDIPLNNMHFASTQDAANNVIAALYDEMRGHGFDLLSSREMLDNNGSFFVEYEGISDGAARAFNDAFEKLGKRYTSSIQRIEAMPAGEAALLLREPAYVTINYKVSNYGVLRYNAAIMHSDENLKREVGLAVKRGHFVKVADEDLINYVAIHESAHSVLGIQDKIPKTSLVGGDYTAHRAAQREIKALYAEYIADVNAKREAFKALEKEAIQITDPKSDIWDRAEKARKEYQQTLISTYSLKNEDEFLAEAYVSDTIGLEEKTYASRVIEILDRYFGK